MKPADLLQILHTAEHLKDVTRHAYTSGRRHESVAEHSWRLALMAFFLRDEFPEFMEYFNEKGWEPKAQEAETESVQEPGADLPEADSDASDVSAETVSEAEVNTESVPEA